MTDNLLNADYLIGHASMSHKVIDINISKTFHLEIGISAEGTILKYIYSGAHCLQCGTCGPAGNVRGSLVLHHVIYVNPSMWCRNITVSINKMSLCSCKHISPSLGMYR